MKLLTLCLASLTFFPIHGQVKPERERRACILVDSPKVLKCQSTLFGGAQEWARTAQVGDKWQPFGDAPITVTFEANGIRSDSDVTRLTGRVEIHTTKLILLADQAVYHGATGAIDASGNVHVEPAH